MTQPAGGTEILPSSGQIYRIRAVHIADKLRLKDLRERMSRPTREFSNYELVLQYGENSFIFIYNYGSAVFFNVPEDVQEKELQNIAEYRSQADLSSTSDVFMMEVQELPPGVNASDGGINRVFFDRVVVSSLSYEKIKIVCMLVAESTALEYYEILIENLLERTNHFSKKLERQGRILESSEDLIKFIGMCLNTKQEIISNLYIVDSPEETWDSVVLDKVHHELKIMLEVDIRYRALEYKIKIIQESVEIIVDLSKSKRETMLELVIILLITFEVILSIIKWH